jgi:hypothetical protein
LILTSPTAAIPSTERAQQMSFCIATLFFYFFFKEKEEENTNNRMCLLKRRSIVSNPLLLCRRMLSHDVALRTST